MDGIQKAPKPTKRALRSTTQTANAAMPAAPHRQSVKKYTKVTIRIPSSRKAYLRIRRFYIKNQLLSRLTAGAALFVIIFSIGYQVYESHRIDTQYQLSAQAQNLLYQPVAMYATKLAYSAQQKAYLYNAGYQPGGDVSGQVSGPKFTAQFAEDPKNGMSVTDPSSQTTITLKPLFDLAAPKQDSNRMIYPVIGKNATQVYTLGATAVKDDIVVNRYMHDNLDFKYQLSLPDGLQARVESNGSLGIYGVSQVLLGNVTAATEKDAALLQNARTNGAKTQLLFTIPAPIIKESNKTTTSAKAAYSLSDSVLTITASGLKKANYPLSIDPTVFVTSAAQFMRGNNETNIDFDVTNDLIQKGSTTGARINQWNAGMILNDGRWNQGTAVAGGFVYAVGGEKSNTVTQTFSTAGTSTYSVPTGITAISIKAWGGGGGGGGASNTRTGGAGAGAGYAAATITVTPGETLNVAIGGGGAGGNQTGSQYMGGGGAGGGYSGVLRSTTPLVIAGGGGGGGGGNGDSGSTARANGSPGGPGGGTSGTNGTGNGTTVGGGAGTPTTGGTAGASTVSGGTTGSSLQGGTGASNQSAWTATSANGGGAGGNGHTGNTSNRQPGGGGGGGGYFGGGGGGRSNARYNGGAGGGGGSSYVTGTLTTNAGGSGTSPGNPSDPDRGTAGTAGNGGAAGIGSTGNPGNAGKVIISYTVGTGANSVQSEVFWSQFSQTDQSLTSPNPGTGACTNWCNDPSYNLPAARAGLSLVAYNGFLYAMGGVDSTNTLQSSIYIAKLGANGEPQLWDPTDPNPANWHYWYTSTVTLPTATAYFGATAYNNRLYILGGQTGAAAGGTFDVESANLNPNGTISSWSTTGMVTLRDPANTANTYGRFGFGVQVYNDRMYVLGGNHSGTLMNAVQYIKLNSDGTMAGTAWVNTTSFATARMTWGGNFTTTWGAYIYLSGGCTAVNGSGYCTNVTNDTQLASLNADGSLDKWDTMINLTNQVMGYGLVAWRSAIYAIGGCIAQSATTGDCTIVTSTNEYGIINSDGDASTVSISSPSGTAPCSGTTPYNCDIPPLGTGAGQGGQMLSATAIMNGYLYIIGGCVNYACSTTTGNVSYAGISSDGTLSKPATCIGSYYGAWCVDNTNRINGATGVAAGAVAVFGGTIYVVGGLNGGGNVNLVFRNTVNTDGSLAGAWTSQSLTGVGGTNVAYSYAYARANPASAGTNPGNLYMFGGCTATSSAGCTGYTQAVSKCNIQTTGAVAGCTTTGQLQIGIIPGDTVPGLGIHAGTVYANYIYLVGGVSPNQTDLKTVRYAKFDNNNNVVAVSGSSWIESPNQMAIGRRRGASFGYNGHIYVVGGYDGTGGGGVLADIEFSKVNVSDGSIGTFTTSAVTINQRWGLAVPVSNSYAYVIGGCNVGASPGGCSSFDAAVQTFQVYNNDSGSPAAYGTGNTIGVDRIGGSATIMNGYIYYAGGCSDMACTTPTSNTYYASLDSYGTIGTWASGGALPAARAWGKLVNAGGALYYVGGQTGSATTTAQSSVYYTTGISSGNPTWGTATNGLPAARTQAGVEVWNNRLYVAGGYSNAGTTQSTVYVSPQQNSGGNITGTWATSTAFNYARAGATLISYANNLYIIGGYDGSNYMSDVQYSSLGYKTGTIAQSGNTVTGTGTAWTSSQVGSKILYPDGSTATITGFTSGTSVTVDASKTVTAGSIYVIQDGSAGAWTYTTNLPNGLRDADGFAANGYMYIIGGRSAATSCRPITLVAPISANTTIATGNNPTGVGEWYETNSRYVGDRYGAAAAYNDGKAYVLGGGCSAFVSSGDRTYSTAVLSQPQVAKYSRMIDTDTDVFPTSWLINGLDNSIGASWQLNYSSSTSATHAWGQNTNFGSVSLGTVGAYYPLDGSGANTNFARYYYLSVSIDSSQTYGYPDDVTRGPTITDLSIFFTADPSKRLRHGKTFTGGELQPLDTPCRQSGGQANCPLP